MASKIKLKNLENTEFEIIHNDGEEAISISSSQLKTLSEVSSATTIGSVVSKMEVFDANGNSLGFIPIYNSIS